MDPALLGTATAFGLSGSAGLNTTLPLLLVALLARAHLLTLAHPYDALTSGEVIAGLVVLAVLEFVVDKVPGLDSAVHAVQLPLSAAAGAILFASQTSVVSHISPGLAILLGLLTAGTVHGVRTVTRPVVTGLTLGTGNPVISTVEDGGALVLASTAVFVPWLGLALLVVLLLGMTLEARWVLRHGARLWRRWRGRSPVTE